MQRRKFKLACVSYILCGLVYSSAAPGVADIAHGTRKGVGAAGPTQSFLLSTTNVSTSYRNSHYSDEWVWATNFLFYFLFASFPKRQARKIISLWKGNVKVYG